MNDRDRIYLQILMHGLNQLRLASYSKNVEYWTAESEHLHNIPSLIGECNEHRHHFYLEKERSHYLDRLDRSLPGLNFLLSRYQEAWRELEAMSAIPDRELGRIVWERAWRAARHRHLSGELHGTFNHDAIGDWGRPVGASVVESPLEFSDRGYRESDTCPLCGETTTQGSRLAAALYPQWENGLRAGLFVWVHPACFEKCPPSTEPTPIPW